MAWRLYERSCYPHLNQWSLNCRLPSTFWDMERQVHGIAVYEAHFIQFRHSLAGTDFGWCFVEDDVDMSGWRWTESFFNVIYITRLSQVDRTLLLDTPMNSKQWQDTLIWAFHNFKHLNAVNNWETYKKPGSEYRTGLDNTENNYKTDTKYISKWWSTMTWLRGKGGEIFYLALIVHDQQITENKESWRVHKLLLITC